jgi:hypothetical protein
MARADAALKRRSTPSADEKCLLAGELTPES